MKRLPEVATQSKGSGLTFVDSHTHLDSEEYRDDWIPTLERAQRAGVTRIVLPATHLESARRIASMAEQRPGLFPTVGIHPHSAASFSPSIGPELRALLPGCVAIGETGLEAFYDFCPMESQLESLRYHLRMAREADLPVILHCRESEARLHDELRSLGPFPAGGVVHCFTGDWDWAQRFLDLGFHLGVNGLVTLAKAENVHAVAKRCPSDRLLLETDGPYLTPRPYRGHRNESCLIPSIAQEIANLRGEALEDVAAATTANANRLFRLDASKL